MGARLGIDYSTTYSCYKGGEHHCGTCGTCRHIVVPVVAVGNRIRALQQRRVKVLAHEIQMNLQQLDAEFAAMQTGTRCSPVILKLSGCSLHVAAYPYVRMPIGPMPVIRIRQSGYMSWSPPWLASITALSPRLSAIPAAVASTLIVLSGGMDSVTLLYDHAPDIALAVNFIYGSNHNMRELESGI